MDFMLLKFVAVIALLVLIYPRSSSKRGAGEGAADGERARASDSAE